MNLTINFINSINLIFVRLFDNPLLQTEPQLNGIDDFINIDENENLQYFFVSDHLGSSSFITDTGGEAVKHLQYLPFGESFVSQTSTSWQTRYTFSGKEKDVETGCSYFGARYYDSDLSVWLSVDPLADKYPHLSVIEVIEYLLVKNCAK
jgi:RHS repeat-associated protein